MVTRTGHRAATKIQFSISSPPAALWAHPVGSCHGNPLEHGDAQQPMAKLLLFSHPSLCTTLKVHLTMFNPPGSSCCSGVPPASRVTSPAELLSHSGHSRAFSQPGVCRVWDAQNTPGQHWAFTGQREAGTSPEEQPGHTQPPFPHEHLPLLTCGMPFVQS